MTVAIAVERFFGLCRPLQRLSSGRVPFSAKLYIAPVVALAVLLNVPKFLESRTEPRLVNASSDEAEPRLTTNVKVTELRTDPDYITYYWMWTRLLATGAIPFLVLAFLNTKIYLSIRHSKQQLRILAIRSALPMAILGRSAPGVPMAELLSNCSNESSPSQSPLLGGEAQNGHAHQIESKSKKKKDKKRKKKPPKENGNNNSSSNNSNNSEAVALKKGILTLHTDDSGGQPRNSPRLVNGQARPITRSVSAFEPVVRRVKNLQFSRSNSSAVTASTSTSAAGQGQGQAPAAAPPMGPMSADMKLAPILFGVVIVFVLCNR